MVFLAWRELDMEPRIASAPLSSTVRELIDKLHMEPRKRELARVFFLGKPVSEDTQLSSVPGLKESHYMQLLFQPSSHRVTVPFSRSKFDFCCQAIAREIREDRIFHESKLLEELRSSSTRSRLESEHPELREDRIAAQYFADPPLLFNLFHKKNDAFLREHPVLVEALHSVITSIPAPSNRDRSFSPNGLAEMNSGEHAQGPSHIITPEMLQQAMNQAMNNMAERPVVSPARGSEATSDSRTPEERQEEPDYEQEIQQLIDIGFPDREQNAIALQDSNGDLEQAIELLIALRESMRP